MSEILDVILSDSRTVLPISHYIPNFGICLSLPAVLGTTGVIETLEPCLSAEELKSLQESAQQISKACPI